MTEDPAVFITQERRNIDFTQAELFGDIIFMSFEPVWPSASAALVNKIFSNMARVLREAHYRPGIDYILAAGSPANIMIASAAIQSVVGQAPIRLLIWSNRDFRYSEIYININPGD